MTCKKKKKKLNKKKIGVQRRGGRVKGAMVGERGPVSELCGGWLGQPAGTASRPLAVATCRMVGMLR